MSGVDFFEAPINTRLNVNCKNSLLVTVDLKKPPPEVKQRQWLIATTASKDRAEEKACQNFVERCTGGCTQMSHCARPKAHASRCLCVTRRTHSVDIPRQPSRVVFDQMRPSVHQMFAVNSHEWHLVMSGTLVMSQNAHHSSAVKPSSLMTPRFTCMIGQITDVSQAA